MQHGFPFHEWRHGGNMDGAKVRENTSALNLFSFIIQTPPS